VKTLVRPEDLLVANGRFESTGLIMATEPLITVLMLGRLGFAPWQFGLAFAVPCAGGLTGSRLGCRLAAPLKPANRHHNYPLVLPNHEIITGSSQHDASPIRTFL